MCWLLRIVGYDWIFEADVKCYLEIGSNRRTPIFPDRKRTKTWRMFDTTKWRKAAPAGAFIGILCLGASLKIKNRSSQPHLSGRTEQVVLSVEKLSETYDHQMNSTMTPADFQTFLWRKRSIILFSRTIIADMKVVALIRFASLHSF